MVPEQSMPPLAGSAELRVYLRFKRLRARACSMSAWTSGGFLSKPIRSAEVTLARRTFVSRMAKMKTEAGRGWGKRIVLSDAAGNCCSSLW